MRPREDRSICFTCGPVSGYVCTGTRDVCTEWIQMTLPNHRVIMDGTECPIQKSSLPVTQQSTYSTYENRNTAKVLIGVTLGGQVSYI